jgi:Tn3 transposase DDE domain
VGGTCPGPPHGYVLHRSTAPTAQVAIQNSRWSPILGGAENAIRWHILDFRFQSIGDEGRLHAEKDSAIADPPSLTDLRKRCEAMMPQVDVGELILEVMTWQPDFLKAFTAASGGQTRLDDLHVTIAAALTAHALNVGFTPVTSGSPALTRSRISHVDQNYLRAEKGGSQDKPMAPFTLILAAPPADRRGLGRTAASVAQEHRRTVQGCRYRQFELGRYGAPLGDRC